MLPIAPIPTSFNTTNFSSTAACSMAPAVSNQPNIIEEFVQGVEQLFNVNTNQKPPGACQSLPYFGSQQPSVLCAASNSINYQ